MKAPIVATSKKKTPKQKSAAPRSSHRRPPPSPKPHDPLVQRLEHVVRIMEQSSLQELAYEDADIKVELSRTAAAAPPAGAVPHPPAPAAYPPAAAAPPQAPPPRDADPPKAGPDPREDTQTDVVVVRSPIVGTFYRSPSPGAPLFTDVGQTVKPGQTLCIVEAMKLMNEIECEVNGTVVEVLVENSQPVQYDDALFRIAVRP